MAKGQITEEQLSSGLKGLGSFATLGTARPLRDSPFRDSRSESKVVEIPRVQEVASISKPIETQPPKAVARESSVKPKTEIKNEEAPKRVRGATKPSQAEEKQTLRKADLYTERVTLQMSAEMRDEIDSLARELQRAKTNKDERITSNTVMRVAIRYFLNEFKIPKGEGPNNEEELLALLNH
jgi:hypothetical protein